jgi:hypothetical protein
VWDRDYQVINYSSGDNYLHRLAKCRLGDLWLDSMTALRPFRELRLDATGLDITNAHATSVPGSDGGCMHDPKPEPALRLAASATELLVGFGATIAEGSRLSLTITFGRAISERPTGIFRSRHVDPQGVTHTYLATHMEPSYASHVRRLLLNNYPPFTRRLR